MSRQFKQPLITKAVTLGLTLLTVGLAVLGPSALANVAIKLSDSDKPSVKVLDAKVTIDAPPSQVWETMTNYNQLKQFLPGYKKSDVVSSSGASKMLDVDMSVSKLLPNYKYRVKVQENRSALQLKMNRISGDFKYMDASYKLQPVNNGQQTVLIYTLKIDPGTNLPGGAQILKASTEKTMKAFQQRAEADHKKTVTAQN